MKQLGNSSPVEIDRAAPPLTCQGVRAFAGEPAIDCGAALDDSHRFVIEVTGTSIALPCERCDAEIQRRQSAHAARQANEGRSKLLQNAGLSHPFVSGAKSLNTIRTTTDAHGKALAAIYNLMRWNSNDGCRLNLRVVGDPGVGKSDLAEGFITEAVTQGRQALYANMRTLLLRLQGSFRPDAPESTDVLVDRYARIPWLALDDLGASKPTRFTADALYELFERRTRNQLPTLVVSNYITLVDLASRLAPSDGDELDAIRPVDRIDELCPRVIVIRGLSLRSTISRESAA